MPIPRLKGFPIVCTSQEASFHGILVTCLLHRSDHAAEKTAIKNRILTQTPGKTTNCGEDSNLLRKHMSLLEIACGCHRFAVQLFEWILVVNGGVCNWHGDDSEWVIFVFLA